MSPRLGLAQNGIRATRPTICYRSTIYTNLRRLYDQMRWRDFLSIPKKNRRTRSKAASEVSSLKGPSAVDLVAPRPTESTPDLRVGASTLPTSSPSTSRGQESNGMQMIISQVTHLTALFSHNTDPSLISSQYLSVPGRDQSDADPPESPDHTVDPGAASVNKSSWTSTAYATTKLAINLVKESSDVFPPLKSVVGGLSAILNHCDVWYISFTPPRPPCLWLP